MNRASALLVVSACALGAARAAAQPTSPFAPPPVRPPSAAGVRASSATPIAAPVSSSRALREHVGVDVAMRLLRSSDADERLRGVQRAAQIGSTQGLALLVAAVEETSPMGAARLDPRALLEVVRGFARSTDQAVARAELLKIVGAPIPSVRPAQPDSDDADAPARVELARQIAALALAGSGEAHAAEQLLPLARGVGPGQTAATMALIAFPPPVPGPAASATSPQALRLAAALGDLRSANIVHGALRAGDPAVRAAALVASADLGDLRALDPARAAFGERDPRVRVAAAEALVLLGAPDGTRVVQELLGDDATALAGAHLAERAQDDGVSKALAARALATQNDAVRSASITALGRGANADSVRALTALVATPWTRGDAVDALARSPSPDAMRAIEALAAQPATLRLAVRAYVVRALVRGQRSAAMEAFFPRMDREDPSSRALAAFARVALGSADPRDLLRDRDPRVRRAAAQASLAAPSADVARALLARRAEEPDETTRVVLGIGLMAGDPDGRVTTSALVDRAESGAPDAALAAMVLARRTDAAHDEKVDALLASPDPVIRAHTARGLGASAATNAAGRLAEAYRYEPNVAVRRAVVGALAARAADAAAPARQTTLRVAARLDPDGLVRWMAARALAGRPAELRASPLAEVAWIRLSTRAGDRPAGPPFIGALVRSDGLAVPIAFDDDGYALVPGVPPGEARLVLAPRVPSYEPEPR
jgi:HEAT repeat protein